MSKRNAVQTQEVENRNEYCQDEGGQLFPESAEAPAVKELAVPAPMIDKEVQDVLPPLSPETVAALKAKIQLEGVREPIYIWKETGAILDGIERYKIYKELGIKNYPVVALPEGRGNRPSRSGFEPAPCVAWREL